MSYYVDEVDDNEDERISSNKDGNPSDAVKEVEEKLRAEIDAVRQELAKFIEKANPIYDTIDEDGNIVEETEDDVKVSFSPASRVLQIQTGIRKI